MPQYTAGVTATSNSTVSTQDLFIEIKAAASTTILIKRVRVGYGSGNQVAPGVDNNFLIQFYRYTTTTGGSPTTLTYQDSSSASGASAGHFWTAKSVQTSSSAAGVKVKNGTTALALGTGTVQLVDQIPPNGRATWEWIARDDFDMIETSVAGFFAVALTSPVVSQVFSITVEWTE
jgi:hypothetical protein